MSWKPQERSCNRKMTKSGNSKQIFRDVIVFVANSRELFEMGPTKVPNRWAVDRRDLAEANACKQNFGVGLASNLFCRIPIRSDQLGRVLPPRDLIGIHQLCVKPNHFGLTASNLTWPPYISRSAKLGFETNWA